MDANVARQRLEEAVVRAMDSASKKEMQWGIDDCALWFANTINDALGYDPAAQWRTGYKDKAGAIKTLGNLGLSFAARNAANKYGWERITPLDAQVGDIGLSVIGGNVTTLICRSQKWFLARNEVGYTAIDSQAVRVAWSVV